MLKLTYFVSLSMSLMAGYNEVLFDLISSVIKNKIVNNKPFQEIQRNVVISKMTLVSFMIMKVA